MPRKGKCFSKCKGLLQHDCDIKTPNCMFTKGTKYKYCRLSTKYRMDKKCVVTRKYRKNEIPTPIKPSPSKIIRKFILNTSAKRKAFFLKSVCSDSGVCITFGNESEKIKKLFGGFTSFEYVEPPIKRVGSVSENGFVNEIKYSRYGYDAYAILKSAVKEKSDNLMYEYIVGQYINTLNKKFPCFLETYGLFKYKSPDKWNHVKTTKTINTNVLKDSMDILINPGYDIACDESKYLTILIQHVKNATTLGTELMNKTSVFASRDLLYILYQIYIVLYSNINDFTHYDLHLENILLYEPVKDKYIQYHYHYPSGEIVKFKSFYIAKIIDYGRCFFDDGVTNSMQIYNDVCNTKECDPNCGEKMGFALLAPEDYPGSFDYITSQVSNMSHDLRLAYMVQEATSSNRTVDPNLKQTLDNIKYDRYYGTEESTTSGLPNQINNIKDMAISLHQLVMYNMNAVSNDYEYYPYDKLGDLHVYLDNTQPMQFIPV